MCEIFNHLNISKELKERITTTQRETLAGGKWGEERPQANQKVRNCSQFNCYTNYRAKCSVPTGQVNMFSFTKYLPSEVFSN